MKVACHIHSEWSYDASWTLEELARFFSNRGYQALLMTEHDRGFSQQKLDEYRDACATASNDSITLVPGIEYSEPSNTIHILTWGDVPFFGENQDTLSMLQHVKDHNGLSVFAHPSRKSAWKRFDLNWIPLLDGIELWNRKSDGISPSPHSAKLVAETGLAGFYGLDFHRVNQNFPLSLKLKNPDDRLETSSLLESIRLKEFELNAFSFSSHQIETNPIRTIATFAELTRRVLAKACRLLRSHADT